MTAEKKSEIDLRINGVSCDLLDKIETMGAAKRPPVPRNVLILFILEEIAAGRNPLESLRPISNPADLAA